MKLKRIGIAGCGAIGSKIAESVGAHLKNKAVLSALYDIDSAKVQGLSGKLRKKGIIVSGIAELIESFYPNLRPGTTYILLSVIVILIVLIYKKFY